MVELFQSQGCSSCPPANAALARYADRADMLALTFAVTYWDRLGWKDTFAPPAISPSGNTPMRARSAAPASIRRRWSSTAAPPGVGDRVSEVEALARKTDRGASGPALRVEGEAVAIGAGAAPAGGAEVWLALYDPRTCSRCRSRAARTPGARSRIATSCKRLVRLGEWTAPRSACRCRLPSGLARAVLVQRRGVGAILAAARG